MKLLLPIGLGMAAFCIVVSAGLRLVAHEPAPAPAVAPRNADDLAGVGDADLVKPSRTLPAAASSQPKPQPINPHDPMARFHAMDHPALKAERAAVAARQAAAAAVVLAERMQLGLFEELKLPEGESPPTPELNKEGTRCFYAKQLAKNEGGECTWHVATLSLPEAPALQADQELLRWMDWRLGQLQTLK